MSRREATSRRGLTLVELLVVMVIGTILLAASVPMLRQATEGRRIREASRQLNALLARAKARAAEIGRPAGVWIERADDQIDGQQFSVRLSLAETPSPYAGDLLSARAQLWDVSGDGRVDSALFNNVESALLTTLVGPGDSIKFSHRGPSYIINRVQTFDASHNIVVFGWDFADGEPGIAGQDDDGDMTTDNITEVGMGGGALGTDVWASPPPPERPGTRVPFQVFRQPVKSSSAPIDLPNGVILDLNNSGMGLLDRRFSPTSLTDDSSVVLMFQPGGSIERVMLQGTAIPAVATVHLQLGRVDQLTESEHSPLPLSQADTTPVQFNANLSDLRNIWVSIGHRTGTVTVAENVWDGGATTFQAALANSREFAQSAQTMGGQ